MTRLNSSIKSQFRCAQKINVRSWDSSRSVRVWLSLWTNPVMSGCQQPNLWWFVTVDFLSRRGKYSIHQYLLTLAIFYGDKRLRMIQMSAICAAKTDAYRRSRIFSLRRITCVNLVNSAKVSAPLLNAAVHLVCCVSVASPVTSPILTARTTTVTEITMNLAKNTFTWQVQTNAVSFRFWCTKCRKKKKNDGK